MEVIKRDDRLETIARDIVYHFPRRGYLGKGMVIAVDKFTAVKMFDKVQAQWKAEIKDLVGRIGDEQRHRARAAEKVRRLDARSRWPWWSARRRRGGKVCRPSWPSSRTASA
jgi:hypothetical protein